MPTKKPRMNLTIEPETKAALDRLAEASGIAATSWANQFLNDSVPIMDSMSEAFSVVKSNPQKASNIMRDLMQGAMVKGAQASLELSEEKPKLRKRGTGVHKKAGK